MFNSLANVMNFLWGTPLISFMVAAGIYFSLKTGVFQLSHARHIYRRTFGSLFGKYKEEAEGEGTLTPFQSMSAVLAGTIGSGNIAGIASAIAIGGPGAAFWMWVIAFVGMAIKMVETSLSVQFRHKGENGEYYGGPMYYMKEGIGGQFGKVLAVIFTIALLVIVLVDGTFVQPNTLATTLYDVTGTSTVIAGIICAAIGAGVIFGGLKGIGNFCGKMVPPMVVIYIIGTLGVIIGHIDQIPEAFGMIFKYAFAPAPAAGGFVGATVSMAMARGAARGIFSSEAGEGTSVTVHATAITEHPIHQSMWGIVEVFIDTFLVSTLTALTVIVSGAIESGETGSILTFTAFRTTWGSVGVGLLCAAVILFAFSSFLGFYIEYKTCIVYLFGEKSLRYLKYLYCVPPLLSATMAIESVWTLADMAVGMVFIPNLIGLIALRKTFLKSFKEYKAKWNL